VYKLKCLEKDFCFTVLPVHTPQDHPRLRLAASLSRTAVSTDEWSVDRRDLSPIFAQLSFSPDLDCFATDLNAVCPRFFSLEDCPGSSGVDFFAQTLPTHLQLFDCPPVKMICPAFQKFLATPGLSVLLLVPDWPSTAFWSVQHPGGHAHPAATAVVRFSPRFYTTAAVNCLFSELGG